MLARALRLYETGKIQAFHDFVRRGMTVGDIGANKGDFTLLAAKLVGPSGRVVSVEPNPTNQHWLGRSLDESPYQNVECLEVALGSAPGTATLHVANKSGWHTMLPGLIDRSEGELQVEVRTVDQIGPFDAIKIDVEGFEEHVLRGARQTLADDALSVVFLDLHPHLGADVPSVLRLLTDAGFRPREPVAPYAHLNVTDEFYEVLATRD
jgi:FkbM family methyltransferase